MLVPYTYDSLARSGDWTPAPDPAAPRGSPADRAAIDRAALDDRGMLVPHYQTFQSLYNLFSKTYSYRYDEAVRHGMENARSMKNDTHFRGLLQERLGPLGRWKWEVAADPDPLNPKDPHSADKAKVALMLAAECRATPDLMKFRRHLGWCAWYGRVGNQLAYARDPNSGLDWRPWVCTAWEPTDGDKLLYSYEGAGHWCVLINTTAAPNYPGETTVTDRTTALRLRRPDYRARWVIATHEIEDAPYEDYLMAGRAKGVGLRDSVYWGWWLRDEMLSWMVNLAEKAGTLGLLMFTYPAGNKEAERKVEENARDVNNRNVLIVPVQRGTSAQDYDVKVVSLPTEGLRFLKEITFDYYDAKFERLFVGQAASANMQGNGLGGSGVADLHAETKFALLEFDALGQAECLTRDFVAVLKQLNHPDAPGVYRWNYLLPDVAAKDKLEAMTKAASLPGRKLEYRADDVRKLVGMAKPEAGDETVGGDDPQQVQPGMGQPQGGGADGGGAGGQNDRQPGAGEQPGDQQPAGGDQLSDAAGADASTDPLPGGDVLALAMVNAADAGDTEAVARLKELASDPAELQGVLDDLEHGGDADPVRRYFADRPPLAYAGFDPAQPRDDLGRWARHPGVAAALREFHAAEPGSLAHRALDAALFNLGVENPDGPPAELPASPRDVAGRLVDVWLQAHRVGGGNPTHLAPIERALRAAGVEPVGEAGQVAPFDGRWHRSESGVTTGTPVRVVRPGWVLPEPDGGTYRLQPAQVEPVTPRPYVGGPTLAYAWSRDSTRNGHIKAVGTGEHAGRVYYGKKAQALLDAQGRRDSGTDARSVRKKAVADAGAAVKAVLDNPAAATAEQLGALADHLNTLTRDQIREMARGLRLKVGGLKAQLAERLVEHVRGERAAGGAEPPASPPPPAPPATPADPDREHLQRVRDYFQPQLDAARQELANAFPEATRTGVRPTFGQGYDDRVRAVRFLEEQIADIDRKLGAGTPPPAPRASPSPTPPAPEPKVAPPTAPPVPPKNVTVTGAHDLRTRRFVADLFGADILSGVEATTPEVLAAAVNAGDGASAKFTADTWNGEDYLDARTAHPGYTATRTFKRDADGSLFVKNSWFGLKWVKDASVTTGRFPGWRQADPAANGTDLLANQVRSLRALGVRKIKTDAARADHADPNRLMVGYYAWPRMGYDATIPDYQWEALPGDLKQQVESNPSGSTKPRSILDLMATEGGRRWWQKNGTDLDGAEFDMSDGSLSMRTLDAYLKEKAGGA